MIEFKRVVTAVDERGRSIVQEDVPYVADADAKLPDLVGAMEPDAPGMHTTQI